MPSKTASTYLMSAGPMSPKLMKVFEDIDLAFAFQIKRFVRTVNNACERAEKRLQKLENVTKELVKKKIQQTETELYRAECLVNKELRAKIIVSQWVNGFLEDCSDDVLDPVSYAFARFSLNISLCYNEVSPTLFSNANVHVLLISLIGSAESNMIVGPSLLALVHLSLCEEKDGCNLRKSILEARVLEHLLKHLVKNNSKRVIAQACKLCASLGLYFPSKNELSRSGCLHAFFDLISCKYRPSNDHIVYYALCAVTNTLYMHDSNRTLCVELDGIKPVIETLKKFNNVGVLIEGCKVIANMTFLNSYIASCVLLQGGDIVLYEVLCTCDVTQNSVLAHAALTALANMCNCETNQSHVGSASGVMDACMRICEHAVDPLVVAAAANLLLGLAWKNVGNKASLGSKGVVEVLVRRLMKHTQYYQEKNHLHCIGKICRALSSILLYTPNHDHFHDVEGMALLVEVAKSVNEKEMLACLAIVINSVIPCPHVLLKMHKDHYVHPAEALKIQSVLKKIRLYGFGHLADAPRWLDIGIQVLEMPDEELKSQPSWIKDEYVEKEEVFKEFQTFLSGDTELVNPEKSKLTRGLVFSMH